MMLVGALFVVLYTFIGGFLAESASDFMQGIVMVAALSAVLITGISKAGGIGAVIDNAKSIPGFLDFFGIAQPHMVNGMQDVVNGKVIFSEPAKYGVLQIVSTLAWGLGYFGMPQVLLKFMAIRKSTELKISRRIATVWVIISLTSAVAIGIIGRILYPTAYNSSSAAENIFILLSSNFFIPILAGVIMAGILAATISSSDSYLLIAASAFSKNIYHGILKKDASDKTVLRASRITLLAIAVIAAIIAVDENSKIFRIVSFAWAGFGATFGPVMLFALFWKRLTRAGAIAGMLTGGIMVFVWKLGISKLGGIFAIYELLPAFLISCIVIVAVSLISKSESAEVIEEFERARTMEIE